MLYSFLLLSGLAAVCGFGSLPKTHHPADDEVGESLGTESASSGGNGPKVVPSLFVTGMTKPPLVLSWNKHCTNIQKAQHCLGALQKNRANTKCSEFNEAQCGTGAESFFVSPTSGAFDLCGWDANKGKCKSCRVSYKCHPRCLANPALRDGSEYDWPSPPPPPQRRELVEEAAVDDEVVANSDLDEEEMNADIHRQLQNKLGRDLRLPPGAEFGQCDSCPAELSTTDGADTGFSEKAFKCAPGVNQLFYKLETNKNETHGVPSDARNIPFGEFRLTAQTCDMGAAFLCTVFDIPSDPCPAGSVAGVTRMKTIANEYLDTPIPGEELLESKLLDHTEGSVTYKIDKFVRTAKSKQLFGLDWMYHPVRASTQCVCSRSFTPDSLDDPANAPRSMGRSSTGEPINTPSQQYGLKGCKTPSALVLDVQRSATLPRTADGYVSCTEARYDKTRSHKDAMEVAELQCLPNTVNEITVMSRHIGSSRGNKMVKRMKCNIKISWPRGKYASREPQEQDADCKCDPPSIREEVNAGKLPTGEIRGECFEVNPMIW